MGETEKQTNIQTMENKTPKNSDVSDEEPEECDRCGHYDVLDCMSNGCHRVALWEDTWEIYFDEGEEVKEFDTKKEMKEMFDLYVSDLKEFGFITIDTPMKRPTKISCYGDDEAEDWEWED